MFSDKDDDIIFPTRTGGAIGTSLERKMLGHVDVMGIRTVIRETDEGTVRLKTRAGNPEFVLTKKQKTEEALSDTFDALLFTELRPGGEDKATAGAAGLQTSTGKPSRLQIDSRGKVLWKNATSTDPAFGRLRWFDSNSPQAITEYLHDESPVAEGGTFSTERGTHSEYSAITRYLQEAGHGSSSIVGNSLGDTAKINSLTHSYVASGEFDYGISGIRTPDALRVSGTTPHGVRLRTIAGAPTKVYLYCFMTTAAGSFLGDVRILEKMADGTVHRDVTVNMASTFSEYPSWTGGVLPPMTIVRFEFNSSGTKLAIGYQYGSDAVPAVSSKAVWGLTGRSAVAGGILEIDVDSLAVSRLHEDCRHRLGEMSSINDAYTKVFVDGGPPPTTSKIIEGFGYAGDVLKELITTHVYSVSLPPARPDANYGSGVFDYSGSTVVTITSSIAIDGTVLKNWSCQFNYIAEEHWTFQYNGVGNALTNGGGTMSDGARYDPFIDVVESRLDFRAGVYVVAFQGFQAAGWFREMTLPYTANGYGPAHGTTTQTGTRETVTCSLFYGGTEVTLLDVVCVEEWLPSFSASGSGLLLYPLSIYGLNPTATLTLRRKRSEFLLHLDFQMVPTCGFFSALCVKVSGQSYNSTDPVRRSDIVVANKVLSRKTTAGPITVRDLDMSDVTPGVAQWFSTLFIPRNFKLRML